MKEIICEHCGKKYIAKKTSDEKYLMIRNAEQSSDNCKHYLCIDCEILLYFNLQKMMMEFVQPERSKREDYDCNVCNDNYTDCKSRCGALNIRDNLMREAK